MNNPNFRNNDDMKKQNRIVYTVLSLSLAVLAILISISVISQRNKAEPSPEKKPETTVKAPVTTERKPETTEKKDETTAAPESSDTADADAGADAAADVLPDPDFILLDLLLLHSLTPPGPPRAHFSLLYEKGGSSPRPLS